MADKCTAHAKSTGKQCTRPAVAGATVCRFHGGAAPQVVAAAQVRLLDQAARELFGKMTPEVAPVDNPLAAYAEFAGEVMAWKQLMHSLLDDLRNVGYESERNGEQIYAAVQLYERAMDRVNTVLSSYARLNIDERLLKVTEAQSKAIMRAIEAVIQHLGASGEQATQARGIAARHLRAVS